MRRLHYVVLICANAVLTTVGQAQENGLCLRVPIMERDVSSYVKRILTTHDSTSLAYYHLAPSDTSNVVVVTDTAQCRVIAIANQRATRVDSLGSPRPVLVVRTGNTTIPASIRYIVWDNTKWGEWDSLAVFGPNLEYFHGFTM
jgi:hypothetical protein